VLATIHANLYYIQPVYNPSSVHFNDKFVNECTLLCMFWSALFPGLQTFYPTLMEKERGYALVMSMFKQHSGIERIFLYPLPIQCRKLLATHLAMSFVEDIYGSQCLRMSFSHTSLCSTVPVCHNLHSPLQVYPARGQGTNNVCDGEAVRGRLRGGVGIICSKNCILISSPSPLRLHPSVVCPVMLVTSGHLASSCWFCWKTLL